MSRYFKSGVLLLALVLLCGLANSAEAQECTRYVAAKFSLTGYPNAYQWANGYLASRGYRQVPTPLPGAIVVYQPGVNATNGSFGHVAIVEWGGWCNRTGTNFFPFRGANQGPSNVAGYPPYFTDGGCSNVSVRMSSMAPGQWGITFWVR